MRQGQPVFIYKITNKLNQKVYIGQSINPPERWRDHQNKGKSLKYIKYPLYISMKKYGVDNFLFEIIDSQLTLEEADEREAQRIKEYNSRNREFGYNVAPGGRCGVPSYKEKFSIGQQNEMCFLYKTLSTKQIAIQFNCSPTTIAKILKNNGVEIKSVHDYPIARKTKTEWISLLDLIELIQNSSYRWVAKKLGVSNVAVRNHLKNRGVDPRTIHGKETGRFGGSCEDRTRD